MTPKVWDVLRCEDGAAIVVPSLDFDPTLALRTLIQEEYGGGDLFAADNPAVVEAAEGLKIETWHSCTKKYIEAEVCDDYAQGGDWWAPNGDGKRSIFVMYIDRDIYTLGEEAEAAEGAPDEQPSPAT